MSGVQLLGGIMLAAFILGLFAFVASATGWREALLIWGMSLAATGFLILAIFLMVGGAA